MKVLGLSPSIKKKNQVGKTGVNAAQPWFLGLVGGGQLFLTMQAALSNPQQPTKEREGQEKGGTKSKMESASDAK